MIEHEPPDGIADLSAMLRLAEGGHPEPGPTPKSAKSAAQLNRRRWVRLLTGLIVSGRDRARRRVCLSHSDWAGRWRTWTPAYDALVDTLE